MLPEQHSIIENTFTKDEINEATVSFYSNLSIPMGSQRTFENTLKQKTGADYVLACQSGSAALHLSLISLGVRAGDEVFCPSFTYAAVPNAILYCGAVPVFIDNEYGDLHVSCGLIIDELERRIRGDLTLPKVIIVVHSYGIPMDLSPLKDLCDEYSIQLVEDAAGAFGAEYQDRHVGTEGSFGIISFNLNKIVSTAGGGALLTNNEDLYNLAKKLSDHGKDKSVRYKYDHIGCNYVMHPFAAELGIIKLNNVDSILKYKRLGFLKLVESYGIMNKYSKLESAFCPNYWRVPCKADLNVGNSETEQVWKPLHEQMPYSRYDFLGRGNVNDLPKMFKVLKNI